MSTPIDAGRDPGLQGERTALSWTRTCLSLAVNALLALRNGVVNDQPVLTATGVLLLLAAGAFVIYGTLRGRALAGHGGHHVPQAAPAIPILLLAASALVACAIGITSTLLDL